MSLAFAQQTNVPGGGGSPHTPAFSASVAAGSVITCTTRLVGGSSVGALTVSDNVNTGNYALIYEYYDSASSLYVAHHWKLANATGIPTITVVDTAGNYGYAVGAQVTGFVGTPTVDTGITNLFTGASGNVTVTQNALHNNEVFLLGSTQCGGSGYNAPWNDISTFREIGYTIAGTPGSSVNLSQAPIVAGAWSAMIAAIYDAPPAAHPNLMMLGVGS